MIKFELPSEKLNFGKLVSATVGWTVSQDVQTSHSEICGGINRSLDFGIV